MLRILLSLCVAVLLSAACPALAQSLPPQDPVLRIDPGMHIARIPRMGADAACTVLATASDDKTVRLWRLPDGKLLRVLRPPIGPGNGGKVFATAVAPDGGWVAAGGWDAANPRGSSTFLYIFDGFTGAVVARLGPLEGVINHLAVSTDGRYLAALLGRGAGLRVWENLGAGAGMAGWRLVAEDRDYGGKEAYGAAFDRSGALYTVADDGKLRRYAPGYLAKPASVVARGGSQPFSVAVHPSGDRVAVSFDDRAAVEVYDATTLAWRYAADTSSSSVTNRFFAVAWSADGQRLYAGGTFMRGNNTAILVWDNSGQGRPRELQADQSTISHLLSCGDGIVFGTAGPAFALFAPDGRRRLWRDGVQADLRGQRGNESIGIAADGRRIHFGLEQPGVNPVLFDLDSEQLSGARARPADLAGADTSSLPVTDWVNDRNPKFGGVPIALQQFEVARSLAIAPDRQRFVLGATWSLRGFDAGGKQLWYNLVPSEAWSVNISPNGRLVVAGYGDGTIRWHRLTDGQELLALFVHKVDRRWVMWTPKGYYIASPGAESLIGWHVNGKSWDETPQWYSADRFRDEFNRPDIVKLVLATLDENQAIEEANKRANVTRAVEDVRVNAPPIVRIQAPGDGFPFRTSQVKISFKIFSATGNATNLDHFRINGSTIRANLETSTKKTGNWNEGEVLVGPLPQGDVTIAIVARDQGGKLSEPASIDLKWDGPKTGESARPRLRALFVGIDTYSALSKLSYAAKDAADLADFFKRQEGKSFSKVIATVLPKNASRADVITGLEWLERESESGIVGDVNLLFLAGHGATDDRQNFYYMTADSDPKRMRATAVSKDDILRTIRNLKTGTRIVLLDACHSGASVDMSRAVNEFADQSLGVQMFASSQGRQYSEERDEWGNGAFTKALIEGLTGKADRDKIGVIEADELGTYVRRRVEALTDKRQTPAHILVAPGMQLVKLN